VEIRAFIYARMSSERLPGKVLKAIGDHSILGIIIQKLKDTGIAPILLTSEHESDAELERWSSSEDVPCFRGDLDNVADRTARCLDEYPCDYFYRVNGDSPFLQTFLYHQARELALNGDYDLISNILKRTYPYGIAVELIQSKTYLSKIVEFDSFDREHITNYFYRNMDGFRYASLENQVNLADYRFTIDTREDLLHFRQLAEGDQDYMYRNLQELLAGEDLKR